MPLYARPKPNSMNDQLEKKVPDQALHYSPPFPSNPKEKAVGFQIH